MQGMKSRRRTMRKLKAEVYVLAILRRGGKELNEREDGEHVVSRELPN
jgi:hypothetical protein